jgi:phage baseplate assembly protein W
MQQDYYSLPLVLDKLMQQQEHPKCTLEQSVGQSLHLLLTTAFGEFPADEQFGCGIWDNDFDNITNSARIKEIMRQSILESVQRYEKRLGKVRVELLLFQEEIAAYRGRMLKKRIEITVTGNLLLTNDKYVYKDSFFMGPLSY